MKIFNCMHQLLIRLKLKKHHIIQLGEKTNFGNNCSFYHPENMIIGNNVSIGDYCSIQTWPEYEGKRTEKEPELYISDNVSIMSRCQISCMNKIIIGPGCLLGDNVFITDNFHGNYREDDKDIMPIKRALYSKGPVVIGKNVWIGRNACIMPGVTIGDFSVIGANSVVTHSIKKNTVVAGSPAKEIIKHKEKFETEV